MLSINTTLQQNSSTEPASKRAPAAEEEKMYLSESLGTKYHVTIHIHWDR